METLRLIVKSYIFSIYSEGDILKTSLKHLEKYAGEENPV